MGFPPAGINQCHQREILPNWPVWQPFQLPRINSDYLPSPKFENFRLEIDLLRPAVRGGIPGSTSKEKQPNHSVRSTGPFCASMESLSHNLVTWALIFGSTIPRAVLVNPDPKILRSRPWSISDLTHCQRQFSDRPTWRKRLKISHIRKVSQCKSRPLWICFWIRRFHCERRDRRSSDD